MSDFDLINNSIYCVIINDFNNWLKTQKVDMNTKLSVDYNVDVDLEKDIFTYNVTITTNDL